MPLEHMGPGTKLHVIQLLPRVCPGLQAPCRKGRSERGFRVHVLVCSCSADPCLRPLPQHFKDQGGLTFPRRARAGQRPKPVRRPRRVLIQTTAPTPATPAITRAASVGFVGGSLTRLRRATGRSKTRIGQPRSRAILRRSLSGLTANGWPTISSMATSVTESL